MKNIDKMRAQIGGVLGGSSQIQLPPLDDEISKVRIATVAKMRDVFQEYIIRRTRKSLDNEKQPISGLADYVLNEIFLDQNDAEKKVLGEIRQKVMREMCVFILFIVPLLISFFSTKEFAMDETPTKSFFNEYRLAVSHVGYKAKTNVTAEVIPPMWKDKEDWEKNRSTKWKAITDIARSLLFSDEEPFPYVDENNEFQLLWNEREAKADPNATAKVVIYCEFTRLLPLLIEVGFLLSI